MSVTIHPVIHNLFRRYLSSGNTFTASPESVSLTYVDLITLACDALQALVYATQEFSGVIPIATAADNNAMDGMDVVDFIISKDLLESSMGRARNIFSFYPLCFFQ